MAAEDLCTVNDVKLARRDPSSTLDALIADMITDASTLIMAYTGHPIVPLTGASTRTFDLGPYTTTREVLIDDLSAPPSGVVVLDRMGVIASTLNVTSDIVTLPRNREAWRPIRRLRIRPVVALPFDGAIEVTGKWGWPAVPGFVRRACVDAVIEWLKAGAALTNQSPDQFEPGSPPARALPLSTRTALIPIKPMVLV